MESRQAARPPHARLVARTDGDGAVVAEEGDAAPLDRQLAVMVDLVASAMGRLGEVRGAGGLRSALLVFEGAVMAIGRDASARNVVVIGDANATQGLVLSHLLRAIAEPAEGR